MALLFGVLAAPGMADTRRRRARGSGLHVTLLIAVLTVCARGSGVAADLTLNGIVKLDPSLGYFKGRLDMNLTEIGALPAPISQCLIQTPTGKLVSVIQGKTTNPRIQYLGDGNFTNCAVRIQPVLLEDDGEWYLSMVIKETSHKVTGKATVKVSHFDGVINPSHPSKTEGDASLELRLQMPLVSPKDLELSSCAIITPSGKNVTLAPEPPGGQHPRIAYLPGAGNKGLKDGVCAATIKDVRDEDSGQWTLEATQKSTLVVHRGPSYLSVFLPRMKVAPQKVSANKGDFVVLQLLHQNPKDDGPWESCAATAPDGRTLLLAGAAQPNTTTDAKVVYIGPGVAEGGCGAKIGPLDHSHSGRWYLVGYRATGSKGNQTATVNVLDPYIDPKTTMTAALGTQITVSCGPENAVLCYLRDPSGAVTSFEGPCSYTIKRLRSRDLGLWACQASLPGSLEEVKATFKLNQTESEHTELQVVDTDHTTELRCRLRGPNACTAGAKWCRMERPKGSPLLVQEGLIPSALSGRYAYTGKGFSSCDCSVTVTKPLHDEDFGTWRCVMTLGVNNQRGGFLSIPQKGSPPTPPKTSVIREPAGGVEKESAKIVVGCQVDRPLSYCWLRSPNGSVFTLDDKNPSEHTGYRYSGAGLTLGECALTVASAESKAHSGTWTCGMGIAGEDDTALDLQVSVDMVVSDSLMVAKSPVVTAAEGEWTILDCHTVLAEGIEYCRFHLPNGSSLHVSDNSHRTRYMGRVNQAQARQVSRMQYAGDGLDKGDCGLLISNVRVEDYGLWSCSARLDGDIGHEYLAQIKLQPPDAVPSEMSSASVVGLCVGLVGVGLLVGVVVGYRMLRYRLRNYVAYRGSPILGELADVTTGDSLGRHGDTAARRRPGRSGSVSSTGSNFTDSFVPVVSNSNPLGRPDRTRTLRIPSRASSVC